MIKDITIGQYFPGKSVIHRLDPRIKILLTALYIVMLFLPNGFLGLGLGAIYLIIAFLLSGINVFQVCLPLIFSAILLAYCFNFKNKVIPCLIVVLIEFALSILTQNDFFKSLSFMQNYAVYFFILMTYLIPIIMLIKRRKNGI